MRCDDSGNCSMFGAFNLQDGQTISSFEQAFDAFCNHLKSEGYVHSWKVWNRAYHEGYDARFPNVEVLVEMCFHDHQASLRCWDYVESGSEPMNALHVAVNRQVKDAMFALYHKRS